MLKTASASGLVAAGLTVSEGFLQPILAQAEPVDENTQLLVQSSPVSTRRNFAGGSYIMSGKSLMITVSVQKSQNPLSPYSPAL